MAWSKMDDVPYFVTIRADIPFGTIRELYEKANADGYCLCDYLGIDFSGCRKADDCEDCLVRIAGRAKYVEG